MARPRKFQEQNAVTEAMEAFWSSGYHATSTEDLCVATGLARSSLYGAFQNKRTLYLTCLREYAGRQWVLQQEVIDAPGLDAAAKLYTILAGALSAQFAHPTRRGCLAVDASAEVAGTDDEVAVGSQRNFDNVRRTIEQIVRSGQRAGELSTTTTPQQWALVLTALLCGNHILAGTEPSIEPLLEGVETAISALNGAPLTFDAPSN